LCVASPPEWFRPKPSRSKLAELYRAKVENLQAELNRDELRAEAATALRSVIEESRLVPEDGRCRVGDATRVSTDTNTLVSSGRGANLSRAASAKRLNLFDTHWVPWIMGIACFSARRYDDAIAALRQARDPINEARGWLAASYAHAGRLEEARATLDEFLRFANHRINQTAVARFAEARAFRLLYIIPRPALV
jgi:tetratricopeptide (TPR) repeat protein